MMTIWVDADACPRAVKDLVFKASDRLNVPVRLVADRMVGRPHSALVTTMVVEKGMDKADDYIVDQIAPGDLVITADIPLAARVVEKKAFGINPRGEMYDEHTVGERLSMRDFLMDLRDTGMELGGPPPFGPKDRQNFANALDRFLTRALKG